MIPSPLADRTEERPREAALWWGGSALVWLGLWAAGFPAPHVDDLFFIGTGVTLSQGGGLHNPWIEPWLVGHFGSSLFHAQPPLQPYALGTWLRCWGVNTPSILGFQCVAGALTCGGAARLLRRAGCPPGFAFVGWLVAAVFVLGKGLRPDAWGAAFCLLAGLAWYRNRRGAWAAGCFAAAIAVAFHPFAAMAVLPAGVLALLERVRKQGAAGSVPELLLAAGAVVAVLGLLAVLLDFSVAEFWTRFQHHARLRVPASGQRLSHLWQGLTVGWEPVIRLPGLLAFAGALALGWRTGDRRRAVGAGAFAAGAILMGSLLYAGYTAHWLWPLLAGLTLAVWSTVRPFRGFRAASAVLALLVSAGCVPWLIGTALGDREPPEYYARLRADCARRSYSQLLVDEVAARYVFDFQLPPGTHDWLITRRLDSGLLSSIATKPHGELWLADERKLELYVPDSGIRADRARLAGRTFSSWLLHPGRVRIVP